MIQTSAWLKELFHEISKKVHAYTPDCYLGFSRLLHGAETIQQSYMEALRAVDLGKTIHTITRKPKMETPPRLQLFCHAE